MKAKTYSIAALIIIVAGVLAHVYIITPQDKVTTPNQRTGTGPAMSPTTLSGVSDTAVSSRSDEQGVDVLSSPFNDIDQKLHVYKAVKLDPKIIQIDSELRDISLCGETYKVKQVFISGVDVIQKVATFLITSPDKGRLCNIFQSTATPEYGGAILAGGEIHITIFDNDTDKDGYVISISGGESLYRVTGGTFDDGRHSYFTGLDIIITSNQILVGKANTDSVVPVVVGSLSK